MIMKMLHVQYYCLVNSVCSVLSNPGGVCREKQEALGDVEY